MSIKIQIVLDEITEGKLEKLVNEYSLPRSVIARLAINYLYRNLQHENPTRIGELFDISREVDDEQKS